MGNITKKTLLLFFVLQINVFVSNGQISIEAIVVDENEIPIADAIAFRINKEKSIILESIIVDSVGFFSFENVNFITEIIKVTGIGYKEKNITNTPSEKKIKITLSPPRH